MQKQIRGFSASHSRTSEYRYRRQRLNEARLRAAGYPGTGSAPVIVSEVPATEDPHADAEDEGFEEQRGT
ncbi:MAG: hypothetical protein ACNA8P_02175, partial [Phycisphaerales bacterium]